MRSLFLEDARAALLARASRLTHDAPARWGRFGPVQMVAHLNDALRMAIGDIATKSKNLPLRFTPIKQLVIYVLPFPRGAPTAPELLTRGSSAGWEEERAAFPLLLQRFAARAGESAWPAHPAFGALSARDWAVLQYRHIDHHLRQFGV